ncbi:MAG: hypothetical protein IKJ43_00530 [Bacilli bacterium]|nr:hypothetical protein [Bacilli bacterium]
MIKDDINNFSLDKLFFDDDYRAALTIITPSQNISVFATEHDEVARRIYSFLYNDEIDEFSYFVDWFKNSIVIQYFKDGLIIDIPEDGNYYLNNYQYEQIKEIFDYLERIDLSLEITSNLSDEYLSFEDILILLNSYIYKYDRLDNLTRKKSK